MLKARNRPGSAPSVSIEIDGRVFDVAAGISVAAAVMSLTAESSRTTPVTGEPRAPYCLMGVCFDCLMEIDGHPNRRACQVIVAEGMRIRRQHGSREVNND